MSADRDYLVFGAPCIGEEEISEVVATLRSGWIGTGPRVAIFEDMMQQQTGAHHAVALHSCTAALHLSMLVAGIGPGDEVITTPLTFVATVNAIVHTGATPVLVDCVRDTQLIDVAQIERAITPRTRAILPIHIAGRICDMDAIGELARAHDLLVIEDAAHALEGEWRGVHVGNISPLTCFSFYVTKNATTAEGGVVTTNDAELAARIKTYALHGMSRDAWRRFSDRGYRHYDVVVPGFKYNMTDLQAAIGIPQLRRVADGLARRTEIWHAYDDAFRNLPVGVPAPPTSEMVHARHLYTLMADNRDGVMQALHERGIGTGVHYRAVHLHEYYRDRFGWQPADFPSATWISDRTLSLPLSACLSDHDVDRVIRSVREVLP